jgi:uncharacterized damage-inducible protein DinB
MQPNEAVIMRDVYVTQLKSEHKATRRVILAVPDDKGAYTPDPKSMTALDLAWHIASAEMWFLNSIVKGEFIFGGNNRPAEIDTGAAVAAWYEQEFPKAVASVEALSGEHMAKETTFAIWTNPLVDTLGLTVRHSVHHRGQLSAYLRPMGAKVPSIYGPSADEPIEMPAQAVAAA